jgi:transcriptional regulator with XRE-family HTH domain
MILPGRLLKQARAKAGLTQAELAARLDTSQPVVARLESGRANPRLETFLKAIAATGHDLRVDLEPTGYPPIDESLIVGNLRYLPADRLRRFLSFYEGARKIAGSALRDRGS